MDMCCVSLLGVKDDSPLMLRFMTTYHGNIHRTGSRTGKHRRAKRATYPFRFTIADITAADVAKSYAESVPLEGYYFRI
jgi:4-aminobutyrate aminotransferase-like enzyme